MAISPTVNAWIQNMGGASQVQPGASSDQLFKKTFSDQAFASLRAKYPNILEHIVTFETFDSDVDKGNAFGAFAIKYGKSLIFIPIVMTDGVISSCEMAYIKDEDRMTPLIDGFVKKVIAENTSTDARILTGKVRVEDTRKMFRNMVRPPASSNVIIASSNLDITDLPNKQKDIISNYLESNPKLLAKIAEFYPIDVLAERLRKTAEEVEEPIVATTEVIDLETITKEAAACLSEDEQKELLSRGYVIKEAEDVEPNVVLNLKESKIDTELNLTQYPFGDFTLDSGYEKGKICPLCEGSNVDTAVLMGNVLSINPGSGVKSTKGILVDKKAVFSKTEFKKLGYGLHCIAGDVTDQVMRSDLIECGFIPVTSMTSSTSRSLEYIFVTPKRSGGWRVVDVPWERSTGDLTVLKSDGSIIIRSEFSGSAVVASDKLNYGYVRTERDKKGDIWVPKGTMVYVFNHENNDKKNSKVGSLISSIDSLRDYYSHLGTTLTVSKENGATHITDNKINKTASFTKEAEAARYLQSDYCLSADQIHNVLDSSKSLILSKVAAMGGMPQPGVPMDASTQAQPDPQQMAMQSPQGQAQVPANQMFNPNNLDSFANLGDGVTMDAGILSSFADDPDIKGLLVDYIPDFISVVDRIGRVILIFCIKKKDIEEYYGTEKYGKMMSDCRRVFVSTGELIHQLKTYIHMA